MPTQLANYNLKEEVDAKAVSVNSSYRSTWHEGYGKTEKKIEDESMAVGPLDSMSQSLPVDEVQVNFLTLQHTPETKSSRFHSL